MLTGTASSRLALGKRCSKSDVICVFNPCASLFFRTPASLAAQYPWI